MSWIVEMKVTTTLIYKNILSLVYLRKVAKLFERERVGLTEPLRYNVFRFTPGGDTSPENSAFSCFFNGRMIRGYPTLWLVLETAWLFTAYHWLTALSLGLKTSIVKYFSDAYTILPMQFTWHFCCQLVYLKTQLHILFWNPH